MADLEDKTVLITAAGQGIGKASVLAFARAGAKVIATDVNDAALAELSGQANVTTRHLDVLDAAAINAAVAEIGRDRRAVQLRRLRPCRLDPGDEGRRPGIRARPQREVDGAHDPRGAARHDRARRRRHHQHVVGRRQHQGRAQSLCLWRHQGRRHRSHQGGRRRLCRARHPLQCHLPGHGREPVARSADAGARRLREGARRFHRAPADGPARVARKRSPTSRSIWPARPIRAAKPTLSTAAGRSDHD